MADTYLLKIYKLLSPNFSEGENLIQLVAGLLTITLVIKIALFIKQRYERHNIFSKGNIESVSSKNPFWGNCLNVICRDDNLKVMQEYHKKLGKNYGVFYGPDPWILSTDLDLLQKLFITEADKHINMTDMRSPYYREFNRSLVQMKGDEWRTYRRAFNPSFAHKQVKADDASKAIESTCDKLIESIRKHKVELDSLGNKSYIIDLNDNFRKYSLEIILKFAYGNEKGANMEPYTKDEVVDLVKRAEGMVKSPFFVFSVIFDGIDSLMSFLMKFSPIYKIMTRLHASIDVNLGLRSKKVKFEGPSNGPKKFIDVLIERAQRGLMDDDTVSANMYFFLVAGFDTVANTLIWMFWLLARHPEIQEKLRQAVLSEGESSTYLDWVMRETLRLYPAVPAAVGHIVSEDMKTSQGQTIFKGTSVLASIYSIHHSEEYWGPDVEQFRPERFSEPLKHPLQYFAFGFGPRNCIGMHLAKAEMRALVSRLLLKFRVEPCASTPEKINYTSPFLIAMILEHHIDVKFVELSSLPA